jgi:hypothetical protein
MPAMRRLNIDYQQPPFQPRRLAGWLLLLTGLALLAEMGFSYDRLQNAREATLKEMRAAKLPIEAHHKHAASRQFTEKDFEARRQITARLSAPWEELFAGLESIKNNNVAFLSIDPDMQTGLLRITGEAKDYASLLTLVAQLRTRKPFTEVFLQQHETKRDDPQHPTSFTLSMRWMRPS